MKVIILALIIASVSAIPKVYDEKIIPGKDATFWQNAITVDGDILVSPDSPDSERLAALTYAPKWPNGEVPYEVRPLADQYFRQYINGAIWHIQNTTCIRFRETSTEEPRLYFVATGNCQSFLGRVYAQQPVELGDACENVGGVVHEILHALGFGHEHKRSDRDGYVKINWDNINTEAYPQFERYYPKVNILLNDFDYDSIMLYGEYNGNNRANVKAMESKIPGKVFVGPEDKPGMSAGDIAKLKVHYGC
nr:astacin-like protein [Physocyclus mexicanus]